MKNQFRFSAALTFVVACAALFGSCIKDDHPAGAAAGFIAGIDGSAATRTENGGDTWVAGDGVGIYMLITGGTIPGNVTGGIFPNTDVGNSDTFLPAAGYRNAGTVAEQSTGGYYWSSEPRDDSSGSTLMFSSGAIFPEWRQSYNTVYASGLGVRCVRQ